MANPLFDQLAKIANRWLPHAKAFLHNARLFDFPYRAHDVLPAQFSPDDVAALREHFFLPYDTIAIEDTGSVVLLIDSEADQRGLVGKRYFLECLPMSVPLREYEDANDPRAQELERRHAFWQSNMDADAALVTIGEITVKTTDAKGAEFAGSIRLGILASPRTFYLDLLQERERTTKYQSARDLAAREKGALRRQDEEAMTTGTLRNVWTALQEVMVFNTPNRFIVERMPESYRKHAMRQAAKKRRKQDPRNRRVLSSDERPTYILLTPQEIRERFHFPTPTGTPKRAHERRRHLRTYPDDPARFPQAAGKTIVIPATWVGPSEVRDAAARQRYRVVLDL